MDTKATLVAAALKLIEQEGEAHFSTRAVCDIAKVKAPTLYHHFGSADGLLNAAIAEAFEQFLVSKRSAIQSPDPVEALIQGWDNYVGFAAARPRLYAAMMARFLSGADLPAAREGQAMLRHRIAQIEAAGRLAVASEAAAQVIWASVNSAAMLFLSGALQPDIAMGTPDAATVESLRDCAIETICKSKLPE
ncbi:TetR/AcrR family transcriptional regulator [Parvibaculum sp.]|uniref:TetR/AcrR family transcriptional regulator n=1 Tax=Parvibaculum sp. TaxID=2024848 RepID=UPI001B081E82|nr:TetR/AcrR family transcriptional regulator [Parvibaculum sp.]MBO6669014.1 TetR/AcrR family transcriptional regulator [Parvibaculum sp.]MBO6692061.1 TetR/AcrR family transcriptional regulator [Parvibaculum sp.]MBO6715436.1 TetR/AcrR family transcriptional regulator [Parvibaculum sp.]